MWGALRGASHVRWFWGICAGAKLPHLQEIATPSNPQTAAQTTQRSLFSDMVTSWRTYFTDTTLRTAWNLTAQVGSKVQSGFNAALSAMVQIASGDPDCSFASECVASAGADAAFTMKNVDDGGAGDEAGNFEVWVGDAADSLLYLETKTIAASTIETSALGVATDVKYVKLRKDSQDRSGIFKLTLIA